MVNKNKKRILVVEDEPEIRRAISYKLSKEGFEVIEQVSGENALEFLNSDNKIDLIWLDLLMPGMGGMKFLEKIKQDNQLKDIPVIVVSVSSGTDKMKKTAELHVVEHIIKGQTDLTHIVEKAKKYL